MGYFYAHKQKEKNMVECTSLTGANAKIKRLEQKQRNLQSNFDAMAAGNRTRIYQYEAEIKKLRAELDQRRAQPVMMTRSEHAKNCTKYGMAFSSGFAAAGGEVIPDPEPTELDKLNRLLAKFTKRDYVADPRTIAEYFADHGVTVPDGA